MDGFAAAQKSSQAMCHFLPKCSSSAAGTTRQKAPSSQQPAKQAPSLTQTQPKSEPGLQQHPQMARMYLYPKYQGPRPTVVLNLSLTSRPDPRAERKRRGSVPAESGLPSKKSRTCSQFLHLGDGSSVQARLSFPHSMCPCKLPL